VVNSQEKKNLALYVFPIHKIIVFNSYTFGKLTLLHPNGLLGGGKPSRGQLYVCVDCPDPPSPPIT
jgi:hypothetical protein